MYWSGGRGGRSAAPARLSMRPRRAVEHDQEGPAAAAAGVRGGLRAHLRFQLRARRPGQLLHPRHPLHRKVPRDVHGAGCRPHSHPRAWRPHGCSGSGGCCAHARSLRPVGGRRGCALVALLPCCRSRGGGRGLHARVKMPQRSPGARVAGLVNTALPRGVAPQLPRTPAEGKPGGTELNICLYSTVPVRPRLVGAHSLAPAHGPRGAPRSLQS